MKRGCWAAGLGLLIVAGGLALRLPRLERRPMHGDEAVHAVKFDGLWQTGEYVYDPEEYHGPALYYATLPIVWLGGARTLAETTEATFRLVPVLFGVGLILLLLLVADGLGRGATLAAGALTALSPVLVFYSRYYIQEMLLAFFAFAVIGCGWRYVQSRRIVWAVLAGVGVGLMHATKETCIISYGGMLTALVLTVAWAGRGRSAWKRLWPGAVVWGGVAAVVVSVLVFSSLGQNLRGPWDSLRAYGTYFERAGGAGLHDHPWYYYLQMLAYWRAAPGPWWSEGLILALALGGGMVALRRYMNGGAERGCHGRATDGTLVRFVALYAAFMVVVYSAIPYKTPWCLIQFFHPLVLLAGVGAAAVLGLMRGPWRRAALAAVLALAAGQLGWQAWRAAYRFCGDYRNPYVYAHPLSGVVRAADWVERLAQVHADGRDMLVRVVAEDSWPLPWYLRGLKRVGYWERPPENVAAPVVIVTNDLAESLPAAFAAEDTYQVSTYGLRPDVRLLVYVERGLYEEFVRREEAATDGP
jgi:uncharacterized protein (TIGR03663 family)